MGEMRYRRLLKKDVRRRLTNIRSVSVNADNSISVELTGRQQSLLLEGLRYISSSVKLRREDPTPELLAVRRQQLDEIRHLVSLIEGNSHAEVVMR